MTTTKSTLMESLYIAGTIASKDIVDALKNKATRTNILVMVGMVVFFSWYSNVRPWDRRIDTVVYDESSTSTAKSSPNCSAGRCASRSGGTLSPPHPTPNLPARTLPSSLRFSGWPSWWCRT